MGLNVLGYQSHPLQRCHPVTVTACGHGGSSHLSPVLALLLYQGMIFYRDASLALLQLVNQWLNFTYDTHVLALSVTEKKTQQIMFFARIEVTISALVGVPWLPTRPRGRRDILPTDRTDRVHTAVGIASPLSSSIKRVLRMHD